MSAARGPWLPIADADAIFAGVRVVDASTHIAGPYATMFLSDYGADVIKVEPPGGDPYRAEPGFLLFNRGKRSVLLDIAQPDDAAHVHALLAHADVFVTDVHQSRLQPLGLGYRALAAANRRLIVVSVAPYGEQGPLVGRPWSPALIAAASGVTAAQASYGGDPVQPVVPLVSYGTGVLAAAAIAAALHARERDGVGRFLEVSELAGGLAMQVGTVTADLVPESLARPPVLGPRGPVPPYALYQGSDGAWFFLACATRAFFDRMLVAIGRPELAADPRLRNAPWGLATPEAHAALTPVLEALFRTQPRAHWLRLFADRDVPAAPVEDRETFFDSALVREHGLRATVTDPQRGAIEMMAPPITIAGAPPRAVAPAPALDAHRAEVLGTRLGGTPAPGRAAETALPLREALPPLLAGVRVLDLAAYIAGPVAARHLAMLGADVVKVEPPGGDPFRVLALGFQSWNLGKRSIAIDLHTAPGAALLDRMVADADVLVANYREGVAQRLHVDHARLTALRPTLVYAESAGYGDAHAYRGQPAFDPLLQALSGAMRAQGGGGEPVHLTVAATDVMAALLLTFGVCAALYARDRDPQHGGRRVRTSLVAAALAAQAGEFVRYAGAPAPSAGGRDYRGPSAGERAYRCSTGQWVCVDAHTAEHRAALAAAIHSNIAPELIGGPADGAGAAALAEAFARRTYAEVASALDLAHVPFMPLAPRRGLLTHDPLRANGLIARNHHPIWGTVECAGRLVRDPGGRYPAPRRAPMLSEHAHDVLAGLHEAEHPIDTVRLMGTGAVGVPTLDVPPEQLREIVYPAGTGRAAALRELVYLYTMDVG